MKIFKNLKRIIFFCPSMEEGGLKKFGVYMQWNVNKSKYFSCNSKCK